mmetsp:Transcript_11566/g.33279  ORF Transcript_11566/g.33279 Transcript_11566/m.33279 type:complete len:203 (-) Transcript_11566:5102-5710(-)
MLPCPIPDPAFRMRKCRRCRNYMELTENRMPKCHSLLVTLRQGPELPGWVEDRMLHDRPSSWNVTISDRRRSQPLWCLRLRAQRLICLAVPQRQSRQKRKRMVEVGSTPTRPPTSHPLRCLWHLCTSQLNHPAQLHRRPLRTVRPSRTRSVRRQLCRARVKSHRQCSNRFCLMQRDSVMAPKPSRMLCRLRNKESCHGMPKM